MNKLKIDTYKATVVSNVAEMNDLHPKDNDYILVINMAEPPFDYDGGIGHFIFHAERNEFIRISEEVIEKLNTLDNNETIINDSSLSKNIIYEGPIEFAFDFINRK